MTDKIPDRKIRLIRLINFVFANIEKRYLIVRTLRLNLRLDEELANPVQMNLRLEFVIAQKNLALQAWQS